MYLLSAESVLAPIIPCEREYVYIQNNSVVAYATPSNFNSLTLGSLIDSKNYVLLIRNKYPAMADLLIDLAKCEAGWRHDGLWGDNYQSYGIFQFQKKTFYTYCKGNWQDFENQLDCAVKMIKMGIGSKKEGWWNCWRIENLFKYEIK